MPKLQILIFSLLAVFVTMEASAEVSHKSYKIIGQVEYHDGHLFLAVFNHTYEKTTFKMEDSSFKGDKKSMLFTATSLVGKQAEVEAEMTTPLKYRQGNLLVTSIKASVPDLLKSSHGEGIWQE